MRRLLSESEALVFNLDKWGYASDLTSIEALPQAAARHQLLKVALTDTAAAGGAGPLGRSERWAPGGLPLTPHQHR